MDGWMGGGDCLQAKRTDSREWLWILLSWVHYLMCIKTWKSSLRANLRVYYKETWWEMGWWREVVVYL